MIKVSERFGLNPSISVCFWCGRERNEIVLFGKLPDDAEAPMHCYLDYEPCAECAKKWSAGATIFAVTKSGNGPAWHGAYPTGQYVVVNPEILAEEYRDQKILFLEANEFNKLFK